MYINCFWYPITSDILFLKQEAQDSLQRKEKRGMPGEVYGELIEQQIPGEFQVDMLPRTNFPFLRHCLWLKTIDGLILLPIKTAITK